MFTTYVKNLNDMIFSTSESPEEQQGTGVLGRIGSWLSPWKENAPTSPTENASASSRRALKSEEKKEREESVRPGTGTRESEEEQKGRLSNRNPLRLSRGVFPCEEVDATQSAHRGGSVVSSAERAGGDPKKEEFVERRHKRVGQGKQREESVSGTLASGNPRTNACQVTHLSSSAEQGVARESDRALGQPPAQRQAQAGRRLHVYLEETSVTHGDQNTCAGQDIVQVTKKDLNVLPKAGSTRAENRKTNVRPVVGGQSFYSALAGVSLKSHKELLSKPESEGATEADSMGRKNAARRKFKKNSQGEEGNSSQEKMPPSVQPVPEGIPTTDNAGSSPKARSPKSDMGDSSADSSSKPDASSQASPEGAENKSSCPDKAKTPDTSRDTNTVMAATRARAADGAVDTEVDGGVYKVERKTETPESKRLSMKVSRSEVKLFTKNVPLSPKKNPAAGAQEVEAALKTHKDEAKDSQKPESDARLHKLKKTDEGPKPAAGHILDKISLFEGPAPGVNKRTFQSQRSGDGSTAMKAPERPKADSMSAGNGSTSAERPGAARSSSPSPAGDKPVPLKKPPRNFVEASETKNKPVLPRKPDTVGMSQKATPSVVASVSKSSQVDNQGQLDTEKQMERAKPETTLKRDGQDATSVGSEISIPKEQSTDSNSSSQVASSTSYRGSKSNSVQANVSKELSDSISPQSKGASRKAFRSKRRTSLEATSPISPTGEKNPDRSASKPELPARKPLQVDEAASASKPRTEKASSPSDGAQRNTDRKQKASKKEPEVFGSQKKKLDSSLKKKSIEKPVNRQEGIPEPSINKDEPDAAAGSSGTKTLSARDPVVSPQREKEAGEQRREKASKESTETSASSPPAAALEQPTKKTGLIKQETPINMLSAQATSTEPNKTGTSQTQKDTEVVDQALSKDVGQLEQAEGKITNETEKHDKDKAQQLLHSDGNSTTATVSESRPGSSATEGCAVRNDQRHETQRAKVTIKPSSELHSTSAPPQGARQTKTTHQKDAVWAVPQPKEAASVTETATEPPAKKEAAPGPPQPPTRPTERPAAAGGPEVVAAGTSPGDSDASGANGARLSSPKPIAMATTATEPPAKKEAAPGPPQPPTRPTERPAAAGGPEVVAAGTSPGDSDASGANGARLSSPKPIAMATTATEPPAKKEAAPGPPQPPTRPTERPAAAGGPEVVAAGTSPGDSDASGANGARLTSPKPIATATTATEPPAKKEAAPGPPQPPTRPTERPAAARGPEVVAAGTSQADSDASGANGARLSSPKPIATATTAAEKAAAAGASSRAGNMSPKESSDEKFMPSSVSKSLSGDAAKQDASGGGSTVKSGDVTKPAPRPQQCEGSPDIESTRAASSPPVDVVEKTAEKALRSPVNERPPVAGSESSPRSQASAVEKVEQVQNKPWKAPPPRANEPMPDISQHATGKKLHFPRGRSRDDSELRRDAPSSWLDVDFPKRTLKISTPKLTSCGSENNLLDTSGDLDDNDFIEKIQKLCAPFSLPPRKHKPLRTPQPPFAMPAIKEARFEKAFDPEEFKFGLSKKSQFSVDTSPSLLASKYQDKEAKPIVKPARASLAQRSMLLGILDPHSRLRDNTPIPDEDDVKEGRDDPVKVKSRLEGSCVLNSLSSSSLRGKRNEAVSPSDAPLLSPTRKHQPPPASPTATDTQAPSFRGEARTAHSVLGDSGLPLPAFNDIKLPDYLEKYLPQEAAKPERSIKGEERVTAEVIGKMSSATSGGEADLVEKLGRVLPVPPRLPEIPPSTHPALFELKKPPALPQAALSHNIRTEKGFHKRPGKMALFEKPQFGGQVHEIFRDLADATSLQLSPLISVKVVRGCWMIYEKPDFQGRCIALEEGVMELTNMWAQGGPESEPQDNTPTLIGSVRLAVCDYSLPHIDLFTEAEGLGRVTPYHDDAVETGSFGVPLSTASIRVHSGVWLVFSDPGFQGMIAVLETGEYPLPESWGFTSPFVGSLRPLKMGGFKVENPNEVKAVLYGEPGLHGAGLEIDSDVFSFCGPQEEVAADDTNVSMASLKILGGLWVGYSEPGFEGQQYILEEGEYLDCGDWGGSDRLGSLRPISADFLSPHLKMFSDKDFGELGVNIELTVPVIDMDGTGYGLKTQSIDVVGGVWVVFEEPGFCGECYLLEKGLYGSAEDWGALRPRVASAMPVVLDDFENAAKFKLQIFSEPGFQGRVVPLEDSAASLQDALSVASCKVLAGSWLAFEGRDFTGRMYLLELGSYPDLRAMGCANAKPSILSLQTVGFEFSLPSITLFERRGLWGKRVVLTEGAVNLQLVGGCSRVQSVLVEGGVWVLYEGINYRGPQILLKPREVPDWGKISGWQKIGSLRPLMQKRVPFRLRNRQTGLMMSVTGDLDDVKLMRVQETEKTDGFEQIWHYQNGHLHCKLLEECCLSPSGSVTMAGSRVGLSPEPDNQDNLWSITPQGFIRYSPTPDLVLEVKGGSHYDKNQVILNKLNPAKLDQQWDVEII
ncbi:uncharacterized protein AB9W97_002975 isoform 2-T2 [Spinachia spinachia]